MDRNLRLQILLNAIDRVTAPLRRITQGSRSLTEALKTTQEQKRALERTQKSATGYAKTQQSLRDTQQQLINAREQVRNMRTQMRAGEGDTAKFRAAFTKANLAVRDLTERSRNQRTTLQAHRQALRDAGFDTSRFSQSQQALRNNLAAANESIRRQRDQLDKAGQAARRYATQQERLKNLHSKGMSAMGHGVGMAYVGQNLGKRAFEQMMPGIDFETSLRDMRITGGLSALEESALGDRIRADAQQWGQFTDQISGGLSVLVANGITQAKELEFYSSVLAKNSVATGSTMEELGNTLVALTGNLGIAANSIPQALDMIAYAGDSGSFEIKDMAKWLPALTPMAASLGMQGKEGLAELVSALQIARTGAGTSDEAANNLSNYLGKITAPDTLRAFDKAGIDLKQRLMELSAEGISPLQGTLQVVTEYMGKQGKEKLQAFTAAMNMENGAESVKALENLGESFALGELFRDRQVLGFIRPAIRNAMAMEQIKTGALGSEGLVDGHHQKRMETSQKIIDQLKIGIQDLQLGLGEIVLPKFKEYLPKMLHFVSGISKWLKENPEKFAAIAKWSAIGLVSLTALGVALAAIGTAMMMIAVPLKMILFSIATFTKFKAVLMGIGFVANIGLLPFLIIIALIAGAAYLIWKNWDWLSAKFTAWWEGMKAAWNAGGMELVGYIASTLVAIGKTIIDWSPLGLFYKYFINPVLKLFGIELPDKLSGFGAMAVKAFLAPFKKLWSALVGYLPTRLVTELGLNTTTESEEKTPLKAGVDFPLSTTPLVMRNATAPVTNESIQFNITAAAGTDERALAMQIQRIMDDRDRQKQARTRGLLYDN